jgi:hypothetical protein
VPDIERQLPAFWREDRHLSFFLVFLVLMTIFVPMVGESRPGRIAIDLTFAIMLPLWRNRNRPQADADLSHHRADRSGIHG